MNGTTSLSTGVTPAVSAKELLLSALTTVHITNFMVSPNGKSDCGKNTFDYIVVGAGSAGSIVASRLSENENDSVLLVEAGDDPPLTSVLPAYFALLSHSKWDWNFSSTKNDTHHCHKDNRLYIPQGKMLGGGSSFNWMCYVTSDPHDYNEWAEITNDDSWSYDNILPLLKLNEDLRDEETLKSPNGIYHGTGGSIGVTRQHSKEVDKYLEAIKELGHEIVLDTDGRNILGFSHLLFNIADDVRQSTAHSFLKPAENRTNLCILKNTMATKILFDNDKNAVGIETVNVKGEKQTYKATKEVIISAGSINSAKLLMLSGIGPKQHLDEMGIPVIADLPVGENLQDHVSVFIGHLADKTLLPTIPLNPYEYPTPTFVGFVAMNKSQPYPDYEVLGAIVNAQELWLLLQITTNFREDIIDKFYNDSLLRNIVIQYITKVKPKSRGKVLLGSLNPEDDPIIHLPMYSNQDDFDDMVEYVRDVARIQNTNLFKSMNSEILKPQCCVAFDVDTKEFWDCMVKCFSSTFSHHSGTCAMGPVVNPKLCVHGTNNVRVIDGSIMPTITSGNTNVPIMMIGQKGADMIKEASCRS